MEQLILIVHVLAAVAIIGLIMIQQGKGADMGASFGSGASQTLFGSSGGGNVLTKATALMATLFFATSFGLAIVAKDKASLATGVDIPVPVQQEVPAVPAGTAEDLPAIDAAALEAGMKQQAAEQAPVEGGLDVPAAADVPATPASDVPAK